MKYTKTIITVVAITSIGIWYSLRTPEVEITKVISGTAVESIYATGNVETTSMVPIRSKITGRILSVEASEGNIVEAGGKLAILDNAEALAKIKETQALVDFYKLELERAEKLLSQGAGSIQNRDEAKSAFLNAEATLEGAKVDLKEYTIFSPGKCSVIKQDGEIGEIITSTYDLFWLDCSGKYRITADVDEEDINFVKIGQKVLIKYDGDTENVYEGAVSSVTPKGDTDSSAFRIRISVENVLPVIIGMSAELNIITGVVEDTMLVPSTSITNNYVWIVNTRGELEKKKITVGTIGDKNAEVKKGLNIGDMVVNTPLEWFANGKTVKILFKKETKGGARHP